MSLGERLQSLRESQGLSQKELANHIGVTTGVVAEWEANETVPNLLELSCLSKALNISSDYLLDTISEDNAVPITTLETEPQVSSFRAKTHNKICWIIVAVTVLLVLITGAFFFFISIPFSENASAIGAADNYVVTILCYDYDGELAATGSGFVAYDSKIIVTNYHVMTAAYMCKVSTNQDISYEVSEILAYSKEKDIAILQLAEDTKLPPLSLGDSTTIKKGENVVAIGSPLGIKNTVSTGVLSGRIMQNSMDLLQFTAPISSGSSGGALFDDSGSVIGITYASYDNGQNLNLAIPINEVIDLYENTRSRPKDVNFIFLEAHPIYKYLNRYSNAVEVSIADLKKNPLEYDGKLIKLEAFVSSGNKDSLYIFLTNRQDLLPGDLNADFATQKTTNFEEIPSITVIQGYECEYCEENLYTGNTVVVIGEFLYDLVGEEYRSYANGEFVMLPRAVNYAVLRAHLIFSPLE